MCGHKYTEEEKQFMNEYVPGHSYKEIQEAFIKKFGWEITLGQVNAYIGNHHLNTGRTGCFEKGHVPSNKGKKMSKEQYEKCKHTMFKSGHVPHNHLPVGSERLSKDGYIEVKIKDPNKWQHKHRIIWEKDNGPVPKGSVVIFKDGNKYNFDITNLICITNAELLYLNRYGLNNAGEVTETGILLAKLQKATLEKSRKLKGEQ